MKRTILGAVRSLSIIAQGLPFGGSCLGSKKALLNSARGSATGGLAEAVKVFVAYSLVALFVGTGTTPAHAKDLLWRIRSGNSTLFLAASIGYLRSSDYPLPHSFVDAFDASTKVVFETDLDAGASDDYLDYLFQKGGLPPNLSLKFLLPSETYRKLGDLLAREGIQRDAFDSYRPFVPYLVVNDVKVRDAGFSYIFSPSYYFFDRVRSTTKSVYQLETPYSGIDNLAAVSNADSGVLLAAQLNKSDDAFRQELEGVVGQWRAADLDGLLQYYQRQFTKFPHLEQIVNRHVGWMLALEDRLRDGATSFAVVDVSHVIGNNGLPALLARRNYQVLQMPGLPPSAAEITGARTVAALATLRLQATTDGDPALAFQWRKDGYPIPGATAQTFEKKGVTQSDSGDYEVRVYNEFGQVVSSKAKVVVASAEPPSLRISERRGLVEVKVSGAIGSRYRVETAFDVGRPVWQTWKDIVMTSGEESLYDLVSTSVRSRFYRVSLVQ